MTANQIRTLVNTIQAHANHYKRLGYNLGQTITETTNSIIGLFFWDTAHAVPACDYDQMYRAVGNTIRHMGIYKAYFS